MAFAFTVDSRIIPSPRSGLSSSTRSTTRSTAVTVEAIDYAPCIHYLNAAVFASAIDLRSALRSAAELRLVSVAYAVKSVCGLVCTVSGCLFVCDGVEQHPNWKESLCVISVSRADVGYGTHLLSEDDDHGKPSLAIRALFRSGYVIRSSRHTASTDGYSSLTSSSPLESRIVREGDITCVAPAQRLHFGWGREGERAPSRCLRLVRAPHPPIPRRCRPQR